MSKFTDILSWCIPDGEDFRTTKSVQWEIGRVGSGLWLIVPVGFRFDLSVPRPFWFLISPTERRLLKAAALHDYALETGWDRVSAAAAFSEAMRAEKVSRWKRLVLVLAVLVWNWQ